MDALIITAYNRQESLTSCLQSVATCNLEGVNVFVSHDARGPKMDTLGFPCIEQEGCIQTGDNIQRALQQVQGSDLVMFIEDDFVVEPEFVNWTRAIHQQFDPFISCADDSYGWRSEDPEGVVLSHSHSHVRAGAMSGSNLRALLTKAWTRHFEEMVQNHLIEHKLLSVTAAMPRAYDTGAAGVNLGKREVSFSWRNPPTPKTFKVSLDFRERWQQDYNSQVKWGF